MEREKQKKIDRERQIKEREAYLQKKKEEEDNVVTELEKNSGQPVIPKKSKFVSILILCLLLAKKNIFGGSLLADARFDLSVNEIFHPSSLIF